ncbi:MAG: hypothetical protein F4174_12970, partial [Acidobacteria bacterium]|nr:hypothetical protein [Acidobacteriota bacterium]
MIEWLGSGHLLELSGSEAVLGFLTPLLVFIFFFLAQLILPGRWVPGYVIDSEAGERRKFRRHGLLVVV